MIGGLIYFLVLKTPSQESLVNKIPSIITQTPTPKPTPSYPPITKDTDLKEEVDKLTPPEYTEDFTNLKQQINP
jgi:hypothetical protein